MISLIKKMTFTAVYPVLSVEDVITDLIIILA
ncbi:hypothetical protein PHIM7_72 [Sinorhizobium phage phiM7]|uniref:Uncharacterized protein n=2 Tax=Emdodecavirus TaxID=1980937 RepID=A0A0F6WCG5_9CAUD|nr:hypothetical protein AVT40_gp088 [Sinorhizobium phage phiN3]YP_009601197.1 hypothetical protein FDH46_gp072 [Sinorhizobium phage phiM7]AKF12620.1 hypothetical protein PHIM7_72 [Sinorhizobium phage phiM7]AKF12980.1 hypothetical protein PHIM19_73 [Sinorhizobium phage phiM19]AKF13352.1 hypothetical protein PHIN3_88 [Sinorhizobium phage phiN3]